MRTADIQKEILRRLTTSLNARYSDLRPDDVENDLFNYHLQFLVQKGYVHKSEDGYALSPKGVKTVGEDKPLDITGDYVDLFKVNVVTIISRSATPAGMEVVVQKRLRHPSYGKTHIPGGAIQKGESWEDGAKRVMKNETGLTIGRLRLLAIARRMLYEDKELFMDSVYFIALAQHVEGVLSPTTEHGENQWAPIAEVMTHESKTHDSLPINAEILKALSEDKLSSWTLQFREYVQKETPSDSMT